MEFYTTTHTMTGKPMVEIWDNGKFIASIYTHQDGLRIVSKYLDGVKHEADIPPSIIVKFSLERR